MRIRKTDTKLTFVIETTYPSQYWTEDRDRAVRKLAKKFGGQHTGSGVGFGGRDNGFDFKSEVSRDKFIKALDKAKKTLKVRSVFISYYLDDC